MFSPEEYFSCADFTCASMLIATFQDLGGTSRQRLIALAESAILGLSIPNPEGAAASKQGFIGGSDALAEEQAFREYLAREGVVHPKGLALTNPVASVNRLVSSERGMIAGRLSWWDWLNLRSRMWVLDAVSRFWWWWNGQKSFTDRDIG